MARTEGETTRLLRTTMDLDLDAVNAKLLQAGEDAIDAATLAKRRNWIRGKDKLKGKGSKSAKPAAKAGRQIRATKGKAKKTALKIKRPMHDTPREGTFAAFVWSLPYDMDVNEVMERARAAKITSGGPSQIYKIRAQYPRSQVSTTPKLNEVATPEVLREQDARTRLATQPPTQPLTKTLTVTPREKNGSARSQFVMLVMRIGIDDAETIMQDFRSAHDRLQASIE